jgi:dipeptidase E
MRLLLASSSTVHGRGYLDHVAEALADFYAEASPVLFIPFALHDADAYAARARERFARFDPARELVSIHTFPVAERAARVADAEAFFVGGGNTFRLLHALDSGGLLEPLRDRVRAGARYGGASAGTNIAGRTIQTTNDMPIVQPRSLSALELVPFQLNPHYLDPDPGSTHMGETREERIRQFHEEPGNQVPVLGLREGAWLAREGPSLLLGGSGGGRLFRPGVPPLECVENEDLSYLIS